MNIIGIILIVVFSVFCLLLFGVLMYLKSIWTIWCTLKTVAPNIEDIRQLLEYIRDNHMKKKKEQ